MRPDNAWPSPGEKKGHRNENSYAIIRGRLGRMIIAMAALTDGSPQHLVEREW
jgi:hypothetical protein